MVANDAFDDHNRKKVIFKPVYGHFDQVIEIRQKSTLMGSVGTMGIIIRKEVVEHIGVHSTQ